MRLIKGQNEREGTIQICLGGVWGTVCDNSYGSTDAQVVCTQLGFAANGKNLVTIIIYILVTMHTHTHTCTHTHTHTHTHEHACMHRVRKGHGVIASSCSFINYIAKLKAIISSLIHFD